MRISVTTEQLEAIRDGIAAGRSRRAIAADLGLDRRTVDRKAKALALTRADAADQVHKAVDGENHEAVLQAAIAKLQALVLGAPLPPRDLAVLARELRESIRALQEFRAAPNAAKESAREAEIRDSAARVVARLKGYLALDKMRGEKGQESLAVQVAHNLMDPTGTDSP